MARIVILGAGVMGASLAATAARAGNEVTLGGSPLDDEIVDTLGWSGRHLTLETALPEAIAAVRDAALEDATLAAADVVVIGVSSPGVDWVIERLRRANAAPPILALVTKGLVADADDPSAPPATYADALPASLCSTPDGLVGIGGPCIARELALEYPTRVTFASRDRANAARLRDLLQTDVYRATTSDDLVGVEACAALKNFLCIGVSAMLTAHRLDATHAKNPLAALFNQAVLELARLAAWLREDSARRRAGAGPAPALDGPGAATGEDAFAGVSAETPGAAFDLAGMGDLHVTVGGGRNSRLGRHLGDGETISTVLGDTMKGVTVEGVDTGRALSGGFRAACERGDLDAARLPLTRAILGCIDDDAPFELAFRHLPG